MKRYYSNRHRTAVPADRHKRAVAYRHVRYKKKHVISTSPMEAVEEMLAEEKTNIPSNIENSASKEPKIKHAVSEHRDSSETEKVEKKESYFARKKRLKKEKYNDELNFLASQPHSSFFQLILDPFGSVERAVHYDGNEYTLISCFVLNVIKWLLVGYVPATVVARIVNRSAFSFAKITFSTMSSLAFRIAAFGFAFELFMYWLIWFMSSMRDNRLKFSKIYSIHSHAIVFEIFMIAAGLLIGKFNITIGIAICLAALCIGFALNTYVLVRSFRAQKKWVGILLVVLIICFFFLFDKYLFSVCGDIIYILKDILNI